METFMEFENSVPSEKKSKIKQLVGFVIGADKFALDILMVQEIIRTPTITNLPNSPEFIEGVINLRGKVLPVIELRRRLKLPLPNDSDKANSRIIIVNVDNKITGFLADSVTKVLKVPEDAIEPPPDIVLAGLDSQYIQGVCDIENSLVILLDFSRILQVDEIRKLKTLYKTGGTAGGEASGIEMAESL